MESQTSRPRRSYRVSNQQFVQDQPRAKWTLYLTRILADLMVGQVYRGNRQNSSFSKQSWEYMCKDFQGKTGLNWDKEQLKNRYGIMKKQYATVKSLLDMDDFSWDDALSMVKGEDEAWGEYIKAHPDAEAIRTNGCPYYKQLCIIFGDSRYSESYDQLNNPMNINEEGSFLEIPISAGMLPKAPSTCVQEELSSSTEEDESIPSKTRRVTPPTSGGRRRNRSGPEDIMARAIVDIAAASRLRTAAAVTQSVERFSIASCVAALDEMQGVDDPLYYAALDLFDKPNARETFMSVKVEKRLRWLKGKCNGPLGSTA